MIPLVSKRDAIIRKIINNHDCMLEYAYLPPLEKDGIMFFKRVGNEEDIIWLKKLGFEVHEDAFVTWRGKFIRWDTVYDLYIDTDPPSESNLKEFCDDIVKKIKTHVDNTFAIDYISETTINFKSKPSYKCIKYIIDYFTTLKFHGTFTSYNNDDFSIIKDDPVSLGIGWELKKEEETRCQLKLTWKYGEVFYYDEEEEPIMEEEESMKDDVLSAMDAAGLADNKNDWNEKMEYSINSKCTILRDENKIDELVKNILESIETYANEGKYVLNIVFNDGKLMDEEVMKRLADLKYKISIKTMTLKKSNKVDKIYFVNSISWENPKE